MLEGLCLFFCSDCRIRSCAGRICVIHEHWAMDPSPWHDPTDCTRTLLDSQGSSS